MCGGRSRRVLLSLALLLLLSSAGYSDGVYLGPDLPEGWYPISETELTELETALSRQATTISELQDWQSELRGALSRQSETIATLATSFTEYESAAQATISNLHRELWLWRGLTATATALMIWVAIR